MIHTYRSRVAFLPPLALLLLSGASATSMAQNLYVSNYGNGNIDTVTPSGSVSVLATVPAEALQIALDDSGDVFAANFNGSVYKVTPGGAVSTFATLASGVQGLARDSSGNLFASNYLTGEIDKITAGGSVSTFATGLANPISVAINSTGDLFVPNWSTGVISEITPGGAISEFASLPAGPTGIATDASGNVYVTVTGHTIYMITAGGSVSTYASFPGGGIYGLAMNAANVLFAVDESDNQIDPIAPGGGPGSESVFATGGGFNEPVYDAFEPAVGGAGLTPEPGTAGLFVGLATAALEPLRRKWLLKRR